MEFLVGWFVVALISGVIGIFCNEKSGFWWGFFLGPLGWLIAAIKDK